jgi:hypothetical protein
MNTTPAIAFETVTVIRIETDPLTSRTEVVHAKTLDRRFDGVVKSSSRTAPTEGATALPSRILTEQLWGLIGHRVEIGEIPEGPPRRSRIITVRDLGIDPEFDATDTRLHKLPALPPPVPVAEDTVGAFVGRVTADDEIDGAATIRLEVPGYGPLRFTAGTIDISGLVGAEVVAYGISTLVTDPCLRLTKVVFGDEVRE